MAKHLQLPRALEEEGLDTARAYLLTYYGTRLPGGMGTPKTGAYFDRFPADGPDENPDEFTAEDIVALGFLSVSVHPKPAVALLYTHRHVFSGLLQKVDREIAFLDADDHTIHAALELESALRGLRKELDFTGWQSLGPVRASKLIARKRPHLYPIYDHVVTRVCGTGRVFLRPFQKRWQEDELLRNRIALLRTSLEIPHTVSDIRIFDVVTWMEGKSLGY